MKEVTAKDRVTQLAKDVLGPHMKIQGFRRTGRIFWRDGPEVCQLITLSMNRWGTKSASDFGVLLGVFWHDVEKKLKNPSCGKMPPVEYRCTFRIDLGWTAPHAKQKSWKVDIKTDLASLGKEVLHDLINYGKPWLEYRSDLKHVLDSKKYLERNDWGYTTHEMLSFDARLAFMLKLGKVAEAKKALATSLANGFPRSKVRAIAEQVGIGL